MKRILAIALALVLVLGLLAGCGSSETEAPAAPAASEPAKTDAPKAEEPKKEETKKADPIELSLSIHDSATSIKGVMYDEWCKQVNEASNGTLNVTLYAGGVLATEKNGLDAMEAGACDIVWVYTTWYPTMFYLSDIVSLPMIGLTTETATDLLWELYETSPEMAAQYADYKVIHMYTNPVSYLHFYDKKVTSLADLKGMNIRSSGGTMNDFLTALGCNSMTISASELYESLEKGIIDGYIQNGSGIASWNLQEVTKYFIDAPMYVGTWLCLMKQETYDALPDEAKAAIDAYSGVENSRYFGDAAQQESLDTYDAMVANGEGEWIELSDEAYAEFKAVADQFGADWVANHQEAATADGVDIQAYYDYAMSLINK